MNKKKSTVVFLLPTFNPGGAENVLIRLANYFSKDYRVCIIVLDEVGPLKSKVLPSVTIENLNCKRARSAFYVIYKSLQKIQPDLVVSTISRLNLILALIKIVQFGSFKLILREVNNPSVAFKNIGYPSLYRRAYKLLYPCAQKILCQSQYMLQELRQDFAFSDTKLEQIYNPVNQNYVLQEGVIPENPYSVPRNLVASGRLDLQKGFDILLAAFADLPVDYYLTIIGEGPLLKSLQDQSVRLNIAERVSFIGYISNPVPYIYHADFTVSSSLYEGLPNVLIESITIGTPVVATRCPGGTAEVIIDGINGYLCESENSKALSLTMKQMIEMPITKSRQEISASAAKFMPEPVYAQYQQLFEGVLNS